MLNIKLLQELPFYNELNVTPNLNLFSGYASSYKVDIVSWRDPLVQLEASKSSVKDLFKDLLNEIKGFEYKIALTALLNKLRNDKSIEYSSIYFNSATKAVINSKLNLDKSFQEILYRIDNWIYEASGWVVNRW